MNILALCGSIRNGSSSHALLCSVKSLLSPSVSWMDFELQQLPFFDPQRQFSEDIPEAVKTLRSLAQKMDCLVISTPEYAHGIPGILKNGLEWLICEETVRKKVAVMIASPSGGEFVKEYLTETLRTMDLLPSPERTLVIREARKQIGPAGEIHDAKLRATLMEFADRLLR